MAGHSKFANIKHRKGAQDKKRANMFTKLAREIIVAAKTGQPDPDFNPRLRGAISAARSASMPKDRIEYAIKRATNPTDGENYEEIRYEGYGIAGVALIIEVLTDNKNRSASEVRAALTKAGGNLGESGSVSFMFDRVGIIQYLQEKASQDEMFEAALEAGASDCKSDDSAKENIGHEIICDPDNFNEVRDSLIEKFGDPEEAHLAWKAKTTVELNFDKAEKILRLIDKLEDNDDVQKVFANYEISDEIAEKLSS